MVTTFHDAGLDVIAPDVDGFRKPVLASLREKFAAKWGKGLWDRVASA